MSEKYFLGTMTQYGFSTEFGSIIENPDYFTYILKGGAGTGKSSIMKKIASEFEDTQDIIRFYCSSDPNSLDAIVLKGSKTAIVDGTSPHVFDPQYPGICQKIINLGDNWNEAELQSHKDEIISVTDKNKSLMARAKRFSTALSNVCGDTYFCGLGLISSDKLEGFLERFKKKILGKKGSGEGKKIVRQLTALTEFGCLTQTETLENFLDVYYMTDDYFACSHLIIEDISKEAARRGYNVTLCPSHVFNNNVYEHLLIPETGVALVSVNPLTELNTENGKIINLGRFYDKHAVSKLKSRLKMNKLTMKSLSQEIYGTLKSAKAVHDEIEKYYISAMDFEKINDLSQCLINEIGNKA
ncbi:MAG: ATPase [Ruminococcus sp.]|nr:ATPase [Ruminococcus sp.]